VAAKTVTAGALLVQQERNDKEGKSHYAEKDEPEVWQVLEKFEKRGEQQVESRQQDYCSDNPGRRDLPEQVSSCHRSCSAPVNL
jgi:hypothetical protein